MEACVSLMVNFCLSCFPTTKLSPFSCQVAALQATDYSLGGALDSAWMCLCGALVMFMHAGFGMLETGCCRAKNASNVLMKNLVNVSRKVEGSHRKRGGRYEYGMIFARKCNGPLLNSKYVVLHGTWQLINCLISSLV